ncbi:MAG: TPR end-of-group domain-containing protein [Pirellulaceae bacterium]
MSIYQFPAIKSLAAFFFVATLAGSAATAQTQPDPELVALMQQAQSLLGQQKFSEAEQLLEPATGKYADKPGPWYLLGYALHAQGKHDAALTMYERSKTFPRTRTNSLYNIACVYSLQNKPDEAFAALDEAIAAGFNNFGLLQGDSDFDNIKDDPRFTSLLPNWLSDEDSFAEPVRVIHKFVGEAANDQFGWTARRVGDIDKDGVTDFITTAPTHNNGAGKVYIYSSATGELLHAVSGGPGQRLGNSAVGIGDVTGDGVPDFVAGAPGGTGSVTVYSGKDASVLTTLTGNSSGGQFGYEVSELGDIDGDGTPDFFVGEMNGDGNAAKSGRGIAYSGSSFEPFFELGGERAGDGFGNAAGCARVSEGEFLLAIGAQNAGPSKRGRVYVYEIKDVTPTLKFVIEGDQNSVNLGQMFISFPGDLNRDGVPDVYASDFSDNTRARGGGKVVVHSGADGSELLAIHGEVAGEGLGTSPSDAGDVDGDGIGDLVIGAWQNNEGAPSGGKIYLYSCAGDGKLLRTWTCRQSGDTLGFDACGIGDVDGDGIIDFLLTSAWSNNPGPKTGRVWIVAGEEFERE